MRGLLAAAVCAMVIGVASPAFAQARATVIDQSAAIRPEPNAAAAPLRVAAINTSLVVVRDPGGAWLEVQFRDPERGLRTGFVLKRSVRIEGEVPLDLSVPPNTPAPAPAPATVAPARFEPPPAAQHPTDVVAPPPARSPSGDFPRRGVVDGGWMIAFPLEKTATFSANTTVSGGTATTRITYPDIGHFQTVDLGISFGSGSFGYGVRWSGFTFTENVLASITVPHPTIANRPGSDTAIATFLEGKQHAFDVPFSYVAHRRDVRAVISGGPTAFYMSRDMVDSVHYNQLALTNGVNLVTITSTPTTEQHAWTLGVNGGADVTWFFSKYLGIGGGGRVNYGSVKVKDALAGADTAIRLGQTTIVVGPRVRF